MPLTERDLPTTAGSLLRTTDDTRRWALAHAFGCLWRWVPLTHYETRPPRRPDELAAEVPDLVVEYVAPPWSPPESGASSRVG